MDRENLTQTVETATAGLSAAEVAERVARGEVNDVQRRASRSAADIVRGNVLTLFNAIIGTLCLLILIFGHLPDTIFGLVIVANTGIGIVQELRAKRALDRLAVVGEEPVRALRDGRTAELRPAEIVLGDLIELAAGDRLTVDGEVTGSAGLEIDESLLTGEADPVPKAVGDLVLSGSFVTAGSGAYTVTRVGRDAYAARLVEQASTFSMAKSELRSGIDRFLRLITWLIVPVAILLAVSQLITAHAALGDAISRSVAGIVTMIPEGLVLLTSIAFAVGVIRLTRRGCLVQELPAIEVLARVDVLCLDKTGTLTEGRMELAQIRELADGMPVRAALAALVRAEARPNPTLQAIGAGVGGDSGWRPVTVVPFSSARKWSGAVFSEGPDREHGPDGEGGDSGQGDGDYGPDRERGGEGHGAGGWVLGAPDVLLEDGHPVRSEADRLASAGLRVLLAGRVAAAMLTDPDRTGPGRTAGSGVEPAALVVLRQRLRPDATATLRYFAAEGVAVKVISGDSPSSVGAVAAALGVPGAGDPVDARTLPSPGGADGADGAADEDRPAGEAALRALGASLEQSSVFGRVSPQQKRTFVAALQAAGHTVAMTGDGVNDVLALKDADLGVAMSSGSGATRAVAKVVLIDDNFAALPHVVAEGRRVLANIERVATLFLCKTVYAILLAVAVSVTGLIGLAGLKGLQFPFLPRHLTLVSTLTIGIPAFVLALAPNTLRARPGFVARVMRFAEPAGAACAAATFASYLAARLSPGSTLAGDRSTATIALFASALGVLALVARPYTWWRVTLVAAMAALFAGVFAFPWTRGFFAMSADSIGNIVTAVVAAAAAITALVAGLEARGWLAARRARRRGRRLSRPQPGTRATQKMVCPNGGCILSIILVSGTTVRS